MLPYAMAVYTSATGAINYSYGIQSITKTATGLLQVNFNSTLSDSNYGVFTNGINGSIPHIFTTDTYTENGFRIVKKYTSNGNLIDTTDPVGAKRILLVYKI